jgi:NTE family protein
MDAPRPTLPPARAIGLFARTVYRQLKQAGYAAHEVVAFANELLGQLTEAPALGPMVSVSDVETALPTGEALLETLDFELKRADRDATTLLLLFELELADAVPDDAAAVIHRRLGRQLVRGLRPTDSVARIAFGRYALVLPGARLDAADVIATRVLGPVIHPRRKEDRWPEGSRIVLRAVAASGGSATAASLLESCEREEPRELSTATTPRATTRLWTPPPTSEPLPRTTLAEGVVLALGGGAARAAAHIGVLRAFDAASIPVRAVAGASAGALVGAMSLSGMKAGAILDRFISFTASSIYREMRRRYVVYRRASGIPRGSRAYFRESGLGFLSNERIAAMDDELFDAFITFFVGADRDMSTLEGPLAVSATDLATGRTVHYGHGPIHRALRASCALPGLFPPQRDGDRVLVDGAMVAEVPVRTAVSLGLPFPVVAVHLARPDRIVADFATSAEVAVRAASVVHRELVREQLRHAHALINAPVAQIGWLEFRRAAETAALGEKGAMGLIDRMRRSGIPPPLSNE